MPFGQTDYTQVDRVTSALSYANELLAKKEQMQFQREQDKAEREQVAGVMEKFAGEVQGKTPKESVQASAGAEAGLARFGGPRSQEASKNIFSYLQARTAAEPPPKQFPPQRPIEISVPTPEGGPTVVSKGGVNYEKRELINPETKESYGFLFRDKGQPSGLFSGGRGGPIKELGAMFERSPEGKLRIKRQPDGKPIPLRREDLIKLRSQVEDDSRQTRAQRNPMMEDLAAAEGDADLYEGYVSSESDNEQYRALYDSAVKEKERIQGLMQESDTRLQDLDNLLEDVNTYNPEVATPSTQTRGAGPKAYKPPGQ